MHTFSRPNSRMLGAHPAAMRAIGGSVGDFERFVGSASRAGAGDLAGPPARNLPPLGKQQAFVNATPTAAASLVPGAGGGVPTGAVQGGRVNHYLAPIAAYPGGAAHDSGPMSADAGSAHYKDDSAGAAASAAAGALKGGVKGGLASLRHRSLSIGPNGSGHGGSGPDDGAVAAPPKPPVAGKDGSGLSKRSRTRRLKAGGSDK